MASAHELNRKGSKPWDRLKPVKQDPLDCMGFVSKGDTRLLDIENQESFYNKIVARYMEFCTHHSRDLESTFSTLLLENGMSASSDPATNTQIPCLEHNAGRLTTSSPTRLVSSSPGGRDKLSTSSPPSQEMWIILLALRKLREALLATSSAARSPVFSQRVHVFCIRIALLAFHPPSYYPPLMHLLSVLHTQQFPLPPSELSEMTTYLILDVACRQQDLANAFRLRSQSRLKHGYESRLVDEILAATITDNWVMFWKVRRKVDGYIRALMQWSIQTLRRDALKAIGRAYLHCDVGWVLRSATGGELSWEELAEQENIGWILNESKVTIRKPKVKAPS